MLPSRVGKQCTRVKTTHCADIVDAVILYRTVLKDIKAGNVALRTQWVFLANMHYNVELVKVRYHTYLVSGKPNSRLPQDKARIYGFVINKFRKPIIVTKTFIKECQTSSIDVNIKTALKNLQDQKFDDTDHLFAKLQGTTGLCSAAFNGDMNEINYIYFKLYGERGSYVPMIKSFKGDHVEIVNFECNNMNYRHTGLTALEVLELQREQLTYQFYREEKLGIRKSASTSAILKATARLHPATLKQNVLSKRVIHNEIPANHNEGNCNSITATFLEFALNRHYQTSTATYRVINCEGKYTFGIHHRTRMMHDPLLINDFAEEVKKYLTIRAAEGDNFWGWLHSRTKDVKLSAGEHVLLFLSGKTTKKLNAKERDLLDEGRLGDICKKFQIKF